MAPSFALRDTAVDCSVLVIVGTKAAMPSSSRASVPPMDYCFIFLDRLRAAVTTCSCTTSLA